jgi:hypothetical protein
MARISLNAVMELTAQAYKEKKSKYNHSVPVREYKYNVATPNKTIEEHTPNVRFMNRSVKDVNTQYTPEPMTEPKPYKRTIFVTYVKGKTIVQA